MLLILLESTPPSFSALLPLVKSNHKRIRNNPIISCLVQIPEFPLFPIQRGKLLTTRTQKSWRCCVSHPKRCHQSACETTREWDFWRERRRQGRCKNNTVIPSLWPSFYIHGILKLETVEEVSNPPPFLPLPFDDAPAATNGWEKVGYL